MIGGTGAQGIPVVKGRYETSEIKRTLTTIIIQHSLRATGTA